MPRSKLSLTCPECGNPFERDQYEVKRNERLGRANLCGRSCQATWMNRSPAKRAEVSERMRAGQASGMNDARWH